MIKVWKEKNRKVRKDRKLQKKKKKKINREKILDQYKKIVDKINKIDFLIHKENQAFRPLYRFYNLQKRL